MILPSKHLREDRALLTVGAEVLTLLREPKTVSRLWTELKRARDGTLAYDWFILSLDLLFSMGLIEFEHGRVARREVGA